jgi:hypothetical protein
MYSLPVQTMMGNVLPVTEWPGASDQPIGQGNPPSPGGEVVVVEASKCVVGVLCAVTLSVERSQRNSGTPASSAAAKPAKATTGERQSGRDDVPTGLGKAGGAGARVSRCASAARNLVSASRLRSFLIEHLP